MVRNEAKGPKFVRYFGPVIEVLKGLGGSGSPDEVRSEVASRLAIPEAEQEEQLSSGSSRFDNQVAWARFYLTRAGLLDSSRRGVWSLTEKGRGTTLNDATAVQLFKDIHKAFAAERRARPKSETDESLEEPSPESAAGDVGPSNHREALLGILKSLPTSRIRTPMPEAPPRVRISARHRHGEIWGRRDRR